MSEGKKITSCWNNNGICSINEWESRLIKLKEEINYWLKNNTEKTVEIKHLFYDDLNNKNNIIDN